MCLECGFYNGRQVLDLKAKKDKREARMKAKQEMIKAQNESIPPSEAEAVSQALPEENKDEEKK